MVISRCFDYAYVLKLFTLSVVVLLSFATKANTGKIQIYLSSDWEGMHLDRHNLNAMKRFNQKHQKIGITHFLNAAYYTRSIANAQIITNRVNQTIKSIDTYGLHIHGWNSLFEKAGVRYKASPSWEKNYHCDLKRSVDCGHDIPIHIYSENQLRKVVRLSLNILKREGFYPIRSFRAGGWMAAKNVLRAIGKEGILIDSSAVDARLLDKKLPRNREFRFLEFLLPIWPNVSWKSAPYRLNLGMSHSIKEFPNNGLFADYLTTQEMFNIYLGHVGLLRKNSSKNYVISYGFHQETADRYLSRIDKLLDLIKSHSKKHNITVEFLTL